MTTPVVTTVTGSDFSFSLDRSKIAVGETATLKFTQGAALTKFGNFQYDDDVISLERQSDDTFIIKGLQEGAAKITFIAPTGQSKSTRINVAGGIDFGDSNCDGSVDFADVVLIMQALANPNKYGLNGSDDHHISERGINNANVNLQNGMTGDDALCLQQYLLGIYKSLPIQGA